VGKIDLKKELKLLYQSSAKEVVQVDVPPLNFLMVDGEGDPNTSPDYVAAVEVLFMVSYAVKFIVRKGPLAIDYGVMPLEGLWWVDDMSKFDVGDKSNWKWTMIIMQPVFVSEEVVHRAVTEVTAKKRPPAISKLRLDTFSEGRCAQILHVGPFSEEGPTIERVHRFIASENKALSGRHHEIYLSDTRKADAAKWKTIIRQPMR
jgi:hypothetical protein